MRGAVLLAACVIAAACGGGATAGSSPAAATTQLTISYQPKGTSGPTKTATLRCAPPGGTHPHPALACAALAKQAHPFAPVPKGVACAELFSGPQRAHVTGTYQGTRIDASFRRSDSCQTSRWARIAPVLVLG
jgi:hypothetical protein